MPITDQEIDVLTETVADALKECVLDPLNARLERMEKKLDKLVAAQLVEQLRAR